MTARNITGAAARLQSISVDGYAAGRNRPGMCLRWSYFAAGITPNLTPAAIAMDAWDHAPAEHRHPITATTIIPKDVPVILGPSPTRTDKNKNAGDVFFAAATGTGLATPGIMTDSPLRGTGFIGGGTIAQRAAQTGRPVLGYLTHWLGYDIVTDAMLPTTPDPVPPAYNPLLEDDMPRLVRVDEPNHQLNGLVAFLFQDRVVRTGDNKVPGLKGSDQIYRLGNAWGIIPRGAKWEDHAERVSAAVFIEAENEINNARGLARSEYARDIATAVWSTLIGGTSGNKTAAARVASIEGKAGVATLSDAQISAIADRIEIPELTISGKAVAA